MDWMYLFYFALALLLFFGAEGAGKGAWNEEYTSLKQTKTLLGISALGVALHHMAQKTCAPWLARRYIIHGLDPFIPMGYMFVAVFLFCSGRGLYKSFKTKPDYLKGFFRRRVLPIVVAFYLSEFIYTAVRLVMGEKMDFGKILRNLSGLHMANPDSWYVVVIPFFYLAFWLAFRFCRREGTAIFCVFVFTLGYTVLGALIDHQNDWWMRGEWWYNSIILFPLGLLFAKYERQVTRFFRKGYWIWLVFFFAAFFLLFQQSEFLVNHRWGYRSTWSPMKVPYRLLSAGSQWLVSIAFVGFCFLLMMKVRLGNKALAWLGGMTLDFYLMHPVFVEMYGFSFLDVAKSAVYIKSVPLYITAVLACSVPAAVFFRMLRNAVTGLLTGKRTRKKRESGRDGSEPDASKAENAAQKENTLPAGLMKTEPGKAVRWLKKLFFPVLLLLVAVCFLLMGKKDTVRVVGGMKVIPPEGYVLKFSDSRYVTWEYKGKDKNPGHLVLDVDIRGEHSQNYTRAETVLEECDWLEDRELYVNPHGVRMARGFSKETSGAPQRRYYVETDGSMLLLSMIEDSRYYNVKDCEAAMKEAADNIRHK